MPPNLGESMKIQWNNEQTYVLINPRMQGRITYEQKLLEIGLKAHIWLATSGSTTTKWVALSKEAVLNSAKSVNQHIGSDHTDIWVHALPDFHIGGLAVWARGFVSGASVVDFKLECPKWNPRKFCECVSSTEATLSALVPTQVYDLVNQNLEAPSTLKAILVGGGRLEKHLYSKAINLGWKCLPTYGLSETGSQVATALPEGSPDLILLPHVTANVDEEGIISISGNSLLSYYAEIGDDVTLTDPKQDGWFRTDDVGELKGNVLRVHGRKRDFVKISGEGVSLTILNGILEMLKLEFDLPDDIALIAMPDERLGHAIHLATTHESLRLLTLIEEFQERVLPFERIRQIHVVDHIPRTAMDKVKREELLNMCMISSNVKTM